MIFLNHSNDIRPNNVDILNHEYGHVLQARERGIRMYVASVFIPSATYNFFSRGNTLLSENYYNMPWECSADIRGQVEWEHPIWAEILGILYTLFMG